MNLNFVILTQRVVEMLVFYLILANVSGKSLKRSLIRLVKSPQGVFYGNVLLLIVYPVATTLMIQAIPEIGMMVDHVVRHVVAVVLLRRAFDLTKFLLANILLIVSVLVVAVVHHGFFAFGPVAVFLLSLSLTLALVHWDWFWKAYTFLSKRNWLLMAICLLSIATFPLPFIAELWFYVSVTVLIFAFFIGSYVYNRNKLMKSIAPLENASLEKVLETLEQLSESAQHLAGFHQFAFSDPNVRLIRKAIENELGRHLSLQTIAAYEYVVTREEIKINVIRM